MQKQYDCRMLDYYGQFCCKKGACRHPCCVGWPISFSMQNYFQLLGAACDPDTRRRLDSGMYRLEHPTEARYAQFSMRWDGRCPMLLENGLCSVHARMGENMLPDLCRLYPRGIRPGPSGRRECSCTNSCEAVLELLFSRTDRLQICCRPQELEEGDGWQTFADAGSIQQACLRILQDRTQSLPERLLHLRPLLLPEEPVLPSPASDERTESVADCLEILRKLLEQLTEHHPAVQSYAEEACACLSGGDAPERYARARRHLEEMFPSAEIWYEHMLVNHVFFAQFPYRDGQCAGRAAWKGLCTVYALLRYIGLGYMAGRTGQEAFTDAMAALFRVIDHTDFYAYAESLLLRAGCTDAGVPALLFL